MLWPVGRKTFTQSISQLVKHENNAGDSLYMFSLVSFK